MIQNVPHNTTDCFQSRRPGKSAANRLSLLRPAPNLGEPRQQNHGAPQERDSRSTFGLMRDLLPVMDNLERAILAGRYSGDFDELISAVELVRDQFFATLTNHGLRKLSGSPSLFDSNQHRASGDEENHEQLHGSVVDVVEQGYRLRGDVLRPSKVIVSRNDSNQSGEDQ
ncbi:heat shock protein GrpE [Roseimaritima multifibrata]|uniref:Protein GrpE n=1 Tax=Roseimaritima multifibrata TaxID=1930274 RepID=A0A517MH99_9BACT|nr:nucleotide exchange factor GrpE [Roseimaritima multifibrata]QDS94260.1 heat shock protein GrpE [Roseimaritima multifibrata]